MMFGWDSLAARRASRRNRSRGPGWAASTGGNSFSATGHPMADHQPYISPSQTLAELTPRALILGVVLGLIFGASNVYLALKIGLTVSASIPIAVLAITILRRFG